MDLMLSTLDVYDFGCSLPWMLLTSPYSGSSGLPEVHGERPVTTTLFGLVRKPSYRPHTSQTSELQAEQDALRESESFSSPG